jgi:hypothetical protein
MPLHGSGVTVDESPSPPDSPGDEIAKRLRDEDPPGGAPVREPRRPKPPSPLAGAVALEPPVDGSIAAVAGDGEMPASPDVLP